MNQREFIVACFKLAGLYLLIIGITSIWGNSCKAYVHYKNLKNSPGIEKMGVFSMKSKANCSKEQNMVHFQNLNQYSSATHGVFMSFMKIILGLYLCRGGGFLLKFLKLDINNKE